MRQKKWTASQQRRSMTFGWSDEKVRKRAAVASSQAEPRWVSQENEYNLGKERSGCIAERELTAWKAQVKGGEDRRAIFKEHFGQPSG